MFNSPELQRSLTSTENRKQPQTSMLETHLLLLSTFCLEIIHQVCNCIFSRLLVPPSFCHPGWTIFPKPPKKDIVFDCRLGTGVQEWHRLLVLLSTTKWLRTTKGSWKPTSLQRHTCLLSFVWVIYSRCIIKGRIMIHNICLSFGLYFISKPQSVDLWKLSSNVYPNFFENFRTSFILFHINPS